MAATRVWTLRVDDLDEADVAPWLATLDDEERARAARFVFARHRVQYIAAHMLTRAALSELTGDAPAAWRFSTGAHGKPAARIGGAPAPVSFNMSHTEGMVGLAAIGEAGRTIGFDLEQLGRPADLAVARRIFCPPEAAWLESLPANRLSEGFLRLWTLKEAFIKATGQGLSADLTSFWFEQAPPKLRFTQPDPAIEAEWHFEQRIVDGGFVAALGVRAAMGEAVWAPADRRRMAPIDAANMICRGEPQSADGSVIART